jgi:outer membrane protein assembly factor BamB
VERGDTLYVFDEAVLTAFDLTTGTVRWRLPSVGTVGLFFDDQGMMYVNTTTASPERIKYSRQIDVSQVTSAAVFKIDPRTGKILWSTAAGGSLAYVSGKFMYTFSAYQADERDANSPYRTGLETPSHVMIRRLNPANGRVMWEHYERRAPLDVRFEDNSIRLVFKKEVEVLRFVAL